MHLEKLCFNCHFIVNLAELITNFNYNFDSF